MKERWGFPSLFLNTHCCTQRLLGKAGIKQDFFSFFFKLIYNFFNSFPVIYMIQ